MNRRSFFKFMPAIFAPFLSESSSAAQQRTEEPEMMFSWDSAVGLGDYKSHLVTTGPISDFWHPPSNENYRSISFPIEGQLTITFEKGVEKYVCFNPKLEKIKEINELNSYEFFQNMYSIIEEQPKRNDGTPDPFNRVMRYKGGWPKFWLVMVTE